MNKNEQIIESLHRVKLLMGYKSSMTLTENVENLKSSFISESIILTEAPSPVKVAMQNILKSLFGDVDDIARAKAIANGRAGISDAKYAAATKSIDDAVIKAGGNIPLLRGGMINSADDVIRALENGTLGATGVRELKVGFLKSSLTGPKLRETLVSQAAIDAKNIKKYQGKTIKEITDDLINNKGYDPTIAKQIAKRLHPNLTPVPLVNPIKSTNWQKFSKMIVNMSTGGILWYLFGAGGLYLAYKWYMDEGSKPFPDCIRKNIPERDFERMVKEKLDYTLITETGNVLIDKYGGGMFFDDKKFKTGNGQYSGTWSEQNGDVVISFDGTDYHMPCEGISPEEECPIGETWDGEKCVSNSPNPLVDCISFPYTKGCENDDIKKIRHCLGMSSNGKFDSDTERVLKSKGYDVIITQEIYDKIMANCGSITTTTTIYKPQRTTYGSDDT